MIHLEEKKIFKIYFIISLCQFMIGTILLSYGIIINIIIF